MAVMRVECSAEEENEWSWWQWMGMSPERTGWISIIGGGEEVTIEEIGKRDGVGKSELLGDGVYLWSQSSAHSAERG